MRLLKPQPMVDGFDAFWAAYPRREKKQAARDAFHWAMQHHNGDGQLLTRIVATIAWQVEQQQDVRYWQMADRWLLGQRWEDEPPMTIKVVDPEWAKIEAWAKEG